MSYDDPRNTIGVVARRTGLSQHVIRVWERRYNAIAPTRTATQRRLYSDADIDRLKSLHQLTVAGHAIGQIARRPDAELKELLAATVQDSNAATPAVTGPLSDDPNVYIASCQEAVNALDARALESSLMEGCLALSQPVFIESVLIPLLHWAGDAWQDGRLRVAHEHLLSACIAQQLGEIRNSRPALLGAPVLLVATPANQLHELGASLAATLGALDGWRVVYLGPNLPADEIASAAARTQARAVALSIVFPPDDPLLGREITTLRRFLPAGVPLMVGGQACRAYAGALEQAGALVFQDTGTFRASLARLRQGLPITPVAN